MYFYIKRLIHAKEWDKIRLIIFPFQLNVNNPVAEVGKFSFSSTHGSEKVWYRTLVDQDLQIIAQ